MKKTNKKVEKPKKISKKKVKEILVKAPVENMLGGETKRKFLTGDFITDTQTGKTFIYHYQHSVDENPERYILIAPKL